MLYGEGGNPHGELPPSKIDLTPEYTENTEHKVKYAGEYQSSQNSELKMSKTKTEFGD